MGAIMDNIVKSYSNLWVDIKNKNMKALPKIDILEINKEAKNDIYEILSKATDKNKAMQTAKFLDIVHKNTDQLHYIRDIKETEA